MRNLLVVLSLLFLTGMAMAETMTTTFEYPENDQEIGMWITTIKITADEIPTGTEVVRIVDFYIDNDNTDILNGEKVFNPRKGENIDTFKNGIEYSWGYGFENVTKPIVRISYETGDNGYTIINPVKSFPSALKVLWLSPTSE